MNADLFYLAGVEGFEPPNAGTRNQCLTTWRHPMIELLSAVLRLCWTFLAPTAGTPYDFVGTSANGQRLTTWRHLTIGVEIAVDQGSIQDVSLIFQPCYDRRD